MHPLRSSDPGGEGDLARLEEHVLGLLGEGGAIAAPDLRREFPHADEADIQRVQTSAEILHAWLDDLGGPDASADRPSRASWLAPGERIGGYVILRRIRGGGMGQVYHAVQESLYPRRVALKVHRLGRDAHEDLRRARREAEVASRLFHPHLAAIHDMGTDEERGLVYFSMQLVEGGDLRAAFREAGSALDAAAARRIATRISEVAGALAELHGRGYVHRDVKPENILLRRNAGRDGQSEAAVLVDFGLVRAERALHGERVSLAGTPGYVPPEAESGASVAPAGDVYSLGVVLYDALGGAPRRRDPRGGPARVLEEELGSLATRGVDRDLSAIVARATRTDPGERYPDAGALQIDLERWLAGDAVSARRAPIHERLWRAARRRPRRFVLVLVSVSLLAGVVFLAGLLIREVREVRGGLAALERGEPTRGWETLAAANPLLVRLLVRERPDLQSDLLHDTQESPLTVVARAEFERGRGAALEVAAAHLERDGFELDGLATHPELEAFLLASLSASMRPDLRSEALRVLARLFFERPVAGPAPSPQIEPFRERLLATMADPGAPRDDVMHAICAIGGCGRPADLGPLLDRAEVALEKSDVETVRLALAACDRVLRRRSLDRKADSVAALEVLGWAVLEQRLAALWRELQLALPNMHAADHMIGAWSGCAAAWGLAHRRTGFRLRLVERFLEGLESEDLLVRAALCGSPNEGTRDLLVAKVIRRPDPLPRPHHRASWAHGLARACIYYGSEDIRADLQARLEDDRELAEAFASGLREARLDLEHGLSVNQLPDERSRLRRLLETDDEAAELELTPTALSEGAIAQWRTSTLETAGYASGGRVGGGTRWLFEEFEPPHLRLPRSGAWLEARLAIPDPPPHTATGWTLVIDHLAASRPYLPFEGQVWIRVELDGVVLAERHRVAHVGRQELRLPIEPDLLPPGEHAVRVTVVEASTTYWIRQVWVRPG
jgi:hypothetical protein